MCRRQQGEAAPEQSERGAGVAARRRPHPGRAEELTRARGRRLVSNTQVGAADVRLLEVESDELVVGLAGGRATPRAPRAGRAHPLGDAGVGGIADQHVPNAKPSSPRYGDGSGRSSSLRTSESSAPVISGALVLGRQLADCAA